MYTFGRQLSIDDAIQIGVFAEILQKSGENMAYQITYGQTVVKKMNILRIRFSKQNLLTACCVMLGIVLLAVCVFPQFRIGLRNMILPGDPEITASALENMVDAIGAGESIQTAITDFCRQILSAA